MHLFISDVAILQLWDINLKTRHYQSQYLPLSLRKDSAMAEMTDWKRFFNSVATLQHC